MLRLYIQGVGVWKRNNRQRFFVLLVASRALAGGGLVRNAVRYGFLGFSLLALTACGLGLRSLGEVGDVVTVEGRVRSIDVSPMAYDGPAVLRLRADGYGAVTIYIQSCLGGCALEAVDQLANIEAGERWQVRGELMDDGSLVLYTDRDHGLLELAGE